MYKFVVGIFIFFMMFLDPVMVHSQEKLSIMSYNIHRGQDANNQDRIKEMAAFIVGSGADIVGLQEVDSVCYRSDQVDQPKVLAELTGMHYAFVRHFAFQGGAYGQAILSKYPISNVINQRLPIASDEPGETRALLTADIEVAPGKKWTIGVAHLDYRNADSRVEQARIVGEIFEKNLFPGILVGDMNAEPGTRTISVLLESFQDTQPDDFFTFPDDKPTKKIDFILIGNSKKIKVIERKVYPVRYSDHLPILSVIEY